MEQTDSRFAELVVEQGLVAREQVDECVEIVRKALELGAGANLPDTLVNKGYLTRQQADALVAELRRGDGKIRSLGGYALIEKIGSGGMGMVYRARQMPMDRIVALKLLRPSLSRDKVFVERFFREARSAAKLNHRNVVQAIDAGDDQGFHYFVMEYIDGSSVGQRLKQSGPFSEQEALRIARDIAAALVHAEQHGIVHRDIKPDNIMLTSDGTAKLADLGIAKNLDADSTVTATGATIGTPYYMSPEQARGEKDINTRSDIYSLGATLFHMVTGSVPFDGETPGVVIAKRLTEATPFPQERRPGLSLAISKLMLRMMAKDADQRFQSAQELLDAVDAVIEGRPMVSEAPTIEQPVTKPHPPPAPRPLPELPPLPEPPPPSKLPWLIAAGILCVGLPLAGWYLTRDSAESQDRGKEAPPVVKAEQKKPPVPVPGDAELKRALDELRADCTALAAKDQFAQAAKLVDAFAQQHLSGTGATEAAKLERELLTRADGRYGEIERAASAAIAANDYARARAALKPAEAFGLDDIAKKAQEKLAEIDSHERSAGIWAKWEDIRKQAADLTKQGQFAQAAKLLEGAKGLPLDRMAELVDEQTQAVEDARHAAANAAATAYAEQSDKVWALFKDRKYADAEKLIGELSARPEYKLAAGRVQADAEVAKLLKELWAAVEKTLSGMTGKSISIGSIGGQIVAVKDGTVTIKMGGAQFPRSITQLTTKQAVTYASLKDDARSKLMAGVFQLAEATDLRAAETALAAAGDGPLVGCCKDRLASLVLGPREVAAQRAWELIRDGAKGPVARERAKQLLELLGAFENQHGKTKLADTIRNEADALRAQLQEAAPEWISLFDGKTLEGWSVPSEGDFSEHGEVRAEDGRLVLGAGRFRTGAVCTLDLPRIDYELSLEAMRTAGNKDFCDIGFPLGLAHCALIASGWDNTVAGLDLVDGLGADRNITTRRMALENGRWYRVRLRVAAAKVEAWIDDEKVIDCPTAGHSFTLRGGFSFLTPLGVFSREQPAEFRNIKLRRLEAAPMRPAQNLKPGPWVSLFDGKTLNGWKPKAGAVRIENSQIVLEVGDPLTGIAATADLPLTNYELRVEAMRVEGDDTFCGISFPVWPSRCCLIVGGYGGEVSGLTTLDGLVADRNVTGKRTKFERGRWYPIRLRVTETRVEAWIDDKQVVGLDLRGHWLGEDAWTDQLRPLGFHAWQTKAALRNIQLRRLEPGP